MDYIFIFTTHTGEKLRKTVFATSENQAIHWADRLLRIRKDYQKYERIGDFANSLAERKENITLVTPQ